jgi:hypothetical protein
MSIGDIGRCATFSSNGAILAIVAKEDHGSWEVRFWDSATGLALSPPIPLDEQGFPRPSIRNVPVFSPNGGRLCIRSKNKLLVWSMTHIDRPVSELKAWSQFLSGMRVDEIGGLIPLDTKGMTSAWQAIQESNASNVSGDNGKL